VNGVVRWVVEHFLYRAHVLSAEHSDYESESTVGRIRGKREQQETPAIASRSRKGPFADEQMSSEEEALQRSTKESHIEEEREKEIDSPQEGLEGRWVVRSRVHLRRLGRDRR